MDTGFYQPLVTFVTMWYKFSSSSNTFRFCCLGNSTAYALWVSELSSWCLSKWCKTQYCPLRLPLSSVEHFRSHWLCKATGVWFGWSVGASLCLSLWVSRAAWMKWLDSNGMHACVCVCVCLHGRGLWGHVSETKFESGGRWVAALQSCISSSHLKPSRHLHLLFLRGPSLHTCVFLRSPLWLTLSNNNSHNHSDWHALA